MTAVVPDSIDRTAAAPRRPTPPGVGGGRPAPKNASAFLSLSFAGHTPPAPSVNLCQNRRTRNTLGKRANIRRKNDDPCGPIPRPSYSNQNLAEQGAAVIGDASTNRHQLEKGESSLPAGESIMARRLFAAFSDFWIDVEAPFCIISHKVIEMDLSTL